MTPREIAEKHVDHPGQQKKLTNDIEQAIVAAVAEAKRIIGDLPTHADLDAAAFEVNDLRRQLGNTQADNAAMRTAMQQAIDSAADEGIDRYRGSHGIGDERDFVSILRAALALAGGVGEVSK